MQRQTDTSYFCDIIWVGFLVLFFMSDHNVFVFFFGGVDPG